MYSGFCGDILNPYTNLLMLVILIGSVVVLLISQPGTGLSTVGMKIRKAIPSPGSLSEFIHMKPYRWKFNQYYSFSEETVRSLGHRFIGRFDSAIFHWDDSPVLDLIIEYKFPLRHLPKKYRPEDIFQAGLYALALHESVVSCSTTRLVNIYCLQDRAQKCMERNSAKRCWSCGDRKIHTKRFDSNKVIKVLKKMDKVWFNDRRPRPSPEENRCRACPYTKGKCNYSAI